MNSSRENDSQTTQTQSLLDFLDVASDAVKCALKKPTNFKRNINHRRYLQRQVKTFVKSKRSKSNCQRKIPSSNLRDDVQDLVREAIKELKFSNCYTNVNATQAKQLTASPSVLSGRPADISCSKNMSTTYRLRHFPAKPPVDGGSSFNDPFVTHKELSYQCSFSLPTSHAEDEYFMSGEELTNNIDINDLYIPELHEPRSPIVNCEDYFTENDLDIPSPLYSSQDYTSFQFNVNGHLSNQNIPNFEQFL